jgi:pyridoxal phosphate-dependent aminotransferase EpsN
MIRAERRILLSIPHMGGTEENYVREAFTSNWLSTVGPNLTALEASFSSLVHAPCVALGSGTAGLHLGLKLLGVVPGDEVISPTLTFAASCNPILYERAIPLFIDSEPRSWNMDPQQLSDLLQKRARHNRLPKAAVVVDLFGQCAELNPIQSLCREYGVGLLEDAAEALGSYYQGQRAGTFGDVGVFSFNGNKIITSTGGGMLASSQKEWVEKARYWSTQARDPDPAGVNNYIHSELGYNYRMSNVLAGIARGQLEVLELRIRQRRAVFNRYREAFSDLPGFEPQLEAFIDRQPDTRPQSAANGQGSPSSEPWVRHTRWLSCFLLNEDQFGMSASDLIRYLDAANVEARPVWKPMHTQKLYRQFECVGGSAAEDLNRRGICLPSSSSLSEDDQQFVIERVRAAHCASDVKV